MPQPMQPHSFRTAICTDYENLLFACQKALELWRERGEEVASYGFANKQTAEELAYLHADYVRLYVLLEAHDESCELCQFVSKLGSQDYSAISASALEKKPVA